MDESEILPDPLEEEYRVTQWFKDNFVPNPKKLQKMATRLFPTAAEHVRNGLLLDILQDRDPVGYLKMSFKIMEEMKQVIANCVEDGIHGIIMIGINIHPIKLKAPEHWLIKEDEWSPEDEIELLDRAVDNYMQENSLKKLKAKVIFFKEFGFSGQARLSIRGF